MEALRDAMEDLERARGAVSQTDDRTELESISASLQEMLDTAGGDQTDGDVAFADTQFDGAAPSEENIVELEENLLKLAENTDRREAKRHIESAQQRLATFRTERLEPE